jgi:hypothetical protein
MRGAEGLLLHNPLFLATDWGIGAAVSREDHWPPGDDHHLAIAHPVVEHLILLLVVNDLEHLLLWNYYIIFDNYFLILDNVSEDGL